MKRRTKLAREYYHEIFLLEDWCSCDKSKDIKELIEFAKEVTKKHWPCVSCIESDTEFIG